MRAWKSLSCEVMKSLAMARSTYVQPPPDASVAHSLLTTRPPRH